MSRASRYFVVSKNAGPPPAATIDRRINCADEDPNMFFPKTDAQSGDAITACATCPARKPCLEFALDTEQGWGVWGGTTPTQRLEILRERGLK